MNELDIPIFRKSYDLYKEFCVVRSGISKQNRYTVGEKAEGYILLVLENILLASQSQKMEKVGFLERASVALNMSRIFIRLLKDTRAIHLKQYTTLQAYIDEIGRMLGGWIRSSKVNLS